MRAPTSSRATRPAGDEAVVQRQAPRCCICSPDGAKWKCGAAGSEPINASGSEAAARARSADNYCVDRVPPLSMTAPAFPSAGVHPLTSTLHPLCAVAVGKIQHAPDGTFPDSVPGRRTGYLGDRRITSRAGPTAPVFWSLCKEGELRADCDSEVGPLQAFRHEAGHVAGIHRTATSNTSSLPSTYQSSASSLPGSHKVGAIAFRSRRSGGEAVTFSSALARCLVVRPL
jgi:hypothetical protein